MPREGMSAFHGQKVTWRACPADEVPDSVPDSLRFECAAVEVPLDYSRPDGKTIKIALNRLAATDSKKRIGSLLTNPGGPGASGLDYLYGSGADFSPGVRARYDIVGMDPRGVGESSEVHCQTRREQADLERKTGAESPAFGKALAEVCKKRAGDLLPVVGTDNAARDLDVVRAALGDDKLNFYGVSYGTLLGQFYADQFPTRTGRMVLDSVVDPTVWPGDSATEAVAFETALKVFVQSCVDRENCPMGSSRSAALKKIDDLVTQLNAKPLQANGNEPITGLSVVGMLMSAMFHEEQWPQLAQNLGAAFRGDMAPLTELLRDEPAAEGDQQWVSQSNNAVRCLHLRPDQRTAQAVAEANEELSKVAPVFADIFVVVRNACVYWPAKSLPNAGRALETEGAPEILLVQNSFDAATPAQWARSVEGQLAKARLVVNVSGGHGFYTMGSCTRNAVDDYLIKGTLPPRGKTCHDRARGIAGPSTTPSD